MRYCGQCGHSLGMVCSVCEFRNLQGLNFCGQCGESLAPALASLRAPARPERRQLTLVFCDLVNSVGLTSKLGEESWRALLGPYQRACGRRIRTQGGRVSRFFGDGVLAIFGYPFAGEDDAERALQAALSILDDVKQLDADLAAPLRVQLQVRVGIASGIVVVGDIIGEGPSEEEAVIGEAVNRAARLQSLAQPNSILIDDDTRSLVGELFSLEDRGKLDLKGFDTAAQVWAVRSAREVGSHARAFRRHLTELFGRQRELRSCTRLWRAACDERGHVLVIAGEPGVGKSRLVEALRTDVGVDDAAQIALRGSPLHQHTAFHPIVDFIERRAGIEASHSPSERWHLIGAMPSVAEDATGRAVAVLRALSGAVAAKADVGAGGDRPGAMLAAMSAPQRRALTLEVLRDQVTGICAEMPLLMVVEDLQWLDPSSRELLGFIVEGIERKPLLLVVTHRADFVPQLKHATLRPMVLARLEDDAVAQMIERIPGGEALSADMLAQVVARSEGVPLFVEELVVSVLERGGVGDIPVTLQASLTARLDRLGDSRPAIQSASAIGREVSTRMLASVTGDSEMYLRERLERASMVGLLQPVRSALSETYRFRHALVQDAAYASLLREDRGAIHARIATVLEAEFASVVQEQPQIVAHHLLGAGETARALPYLLAAGRSAAARFNNVEALAHLTRALRLVQRLPNTLENRRLTLELLVERGPVLINTRGVGRTVVRRNYNRALQLCEQLDEPDLHFAAYWGALRIDESYASKLDRTQGLLRLAELTQDPGILLQAHHRQWATVFHMARLDECITHADSGLALYDSGDFRDHGLRYAGHDPKVCGHGELALAHWLKGDAIAGEEQIQLALAWADELDHPGTTAHALDIACMLARYGRDVPSLRERAERMHDLASRHRMLDHASKARVFIAWADSQSTDAAVALTDIEREMRYQETNNTPEDFPVFYESWMEILMLAGELERACEISDRAIEVATRNEILYWGPELCRRRALLSRLTGEPAEIAAQWLRRAADEALSLGLGALALRVGVTQAELALDNDDSVAARSILDTVIAASAACTGPEIEAARIQRARL